MMNILISVALGGAFGSVLRYLLAQIVTFPLGTLSINIVGSFLIGVSYVFFDERLQSPVAAFVTIGMLGGFTTFSAFSLDIFRLIEAGRTGAALIYVSVSLGGALLACFGGVLLMRSIG